jgi:hypothetical protein
LSILPSILTDSLIPRQEEGDTKLNQRFIRKGT